MKAIKIRRDVSRQVWADSSTSLATWAPIGPIYARGPRGGRYVAVPPWQLTISDVARWDMNLITLVWMSSGAKYVRPRRKS